MQHLKQLQVALVILTLAILLLIMTGVIFVFTAEPEHQTATAITPFPIPDSTGIAAPGVLDAVAQQGQILFQNNCTVCHTMTTEVIVGPGLNGVTSRKPEAWLSSWIKNSQQVIASGDKYAVDLYNKFNKTTMPSFSNFSDAELTALVKYMEAVSK